MYARRYANAIAAASWAMVGIRADRPERIAIAPGARKQKNFVNCIGTVIGCDDNQSEVSTKGLTK
jgi:hypothetical protein